ncbi:MAG: S9 family peptidase [bacterium]
MLSSSSSSSDPLRLALLAAVPLMMIQRTVSFRRALRGNYRILSTAERAAASKLFSDQNVRPLLRSWPRPGVRDVLKRQLVVALAAGDDMASSIHRELIEPPVCPERPHHFEDEPAPRSDNYYWLRDDDRKDKDVLDYLKAENEYCKTMMADTESLQGRLFAEFRGRIQEQDESAGVVHGAYRYYTRTVEGEQYAVHCRRRIVDGVEQGEEVLLDENKEAKRFSFYMTGGCEVSPDHRMLAFGVDTTGNEMFELFVRDLQTGKTTSVVQSTDGSYAWALDNKTLFYVTKDELDRPYKVWRHTLGQSNKEDYLVHTEEDDQFYLGIHLSRSQKFVYVHAGSAITSEVRYIDASEPEGPLVEILPRVSDVEYGVADRGDQFIITRRTEKHFNSEVLVADRADPAGSLRVLIPHDAKVKIEDVEVSTRYLSVFQRCNGLQQAVVHDLGGDSTKGHRIVPGSFRHGKPISFDDPTYELGAAAQGDFDSRYLRYVYSSLTTPSTVVEYDCETHEKRVVKVMPVLGDFAANKGKYVSERVFATAPDGVKVPISIVYRSDLVKKDGQAPMLLDAYASYEICNDADFRATRLSLLDRGYVFGIAHCRGGGEMGRAWYLDGKFLKKKNTFSDFLACCEEVVTRGFTTPERLAISGRSAGGLTMGASINEAVKRGGGFFGAAILGVPFVDVLTTMQDFTIPLTAIETEEWGNPAKEEVYYHYMREYSPVDNILEGKKYPSLLVTGGLHDPRVGYWEPAKWVANIRSKTDTSDNLVMLKIDLGAGHFSQSGRFDKLKELAVEYAFLLKQHGMVESTPQ